MNKRLSYVNERIIKKYKELIELHNEKNRRLSKDHMMMTQDLDNKIYDLRQAVEVLKNW